MVRYVSSRVAIALVTVFVAVSMNFVLFRAAPGDPIAQFSNVRGGLSPTEIQDLRERFGLDGSILDQYVAYLRQLAHGDLGISFANSQPVSKNLLDAYANTLPMVSVAIGFAAILGISAGVLAAWRRKTASDRGAVATGLVLYSLPTQWLGLMLLLLFRGKLPSGGRVDQFLVDPSWLEHTLDVAKHMILPSLTLGLVLFGQYALITRSAMLESLGQDYILTAKAKGLPPRRIVWRYGLRNSLLPVVTLLGLSVGFVTAGALLVETVFSWPGIGRAIYQAIFARDFPMLQGAFLIITVTMVTLNLLIDVLYLRLDPRVTQ